MEPQPGFDVVAVNGMVCRSSHPQIHERSGVMKKGGTRRFRWVYKFLVVVLILFCGYLFYLDTILKQRFEGKRWSLPGEVYARPLELYAGKHLSTALPRSQNNKQT